MRVSWFSFLFLPHSLAERRSFIWLSPGSSAAMKSRKFMGSPRAVLREPAIDSWGADGNRGRYLVVLDARSRGKGSFHEHAGSLSPRPHQVRSICAQTQTQSRGCRPRRFGGLSCRTVPAKPREQDRGTSLGDAAEFLPLCPGSGADTGRPFDNSRITEDPAELAGLSSAGRCRAFARPARRENTHWVARPRHAGGFVFHRSACV